MLKGIYILAGSTVIMFASIFQTPGHVPWTSQLPSWMPPIIERNVWSVRYLWKDKADSDIVTWPPSALNAQPQLRLWLARTAIEQDNVLHAQDLLEPLLSDDQDVETKRLQAQIWYRQGQFADAFGTWSEGDNIQELHWAAQQMVAQERLGWAIHAQRLAYERNQLASVHPFVQFLWKTLGQPQLAERIIQETMDRHQLIQEQQRPLQRRLGQLYLDQEKWDDAAKVYETLLDEDDMDMYSALLLGWAYYERGDGVERSLTRFQQAIDVKPEKGDGYLAMGQVLAKENRYEEADPWFVKAVARRQDALSWYLLYARNALALGDEEKAVQRYEETSNRFPDSAKARYELAGIYLRMGRWADALATIESAWQRTSADVPLAYYERLGEIYLASGEIDGALMIYQQILQGNPNHKIAKQYVNYLNAISPGFIPF